MSIILIWFLDFCPYPSLHSLCRMNFHNTLKAIELCSESLDIRTHCQLSKRAFLLSKTNKISHYLLGSIFAQIDPLFRFFCQRMQIVANFVFDEQNPTLGQKFKNHIKIMDIKAHGEHSGLKVFFSIVIE